MIFMHMNSILRWSCIFAYAVFQMCAVTTCIWVTTCLASLLQLMSTISFGAALIWFWYIALRESVVMPIICFVALLGKEGSAIT